MQKSNFLLCVLFMLLSMNVFATTVQFEVKYDETIITNATVVIWDEGGFNEQAVYNADSLTYVADIPDGNYTYYVKTQDYAVHAGPITISSSNNYFTISLEEGTALVFDINDGESPITDAKVRIGGQNADYNADSLAYIIRLTDGSYDYSVSASGYIGVSGVATVPDTANNHYSITLEEGARVVFLVSDGLLNIWDATVTVNGEVAEFREQEYMIDLTKGTYDYTITAPGFAEYTGTITVPSGNNRYNVVLEKATTVKFEVNDGILPILDATVTVNGKVAEYDSGLQEHSIDLGAGTYDYSVTAPGYVEVTGSITVPEGNNYYSVTLQMAYNIKFVVSDKNTAVENAEIIMAGDTLTTNADGEVIFESFTAGKYGYSISAEGHNVYTDSVEVTDSDVTETVVLTVTGVEDFANADIRVYPNPTADKITVRLSSQYNGDVQLVVRNADGHMVKQAVYNHSSNIELNIQDIPAGMYFLEIRNANTQNVVKIMKQ